MRKILSYFLLLITNLFASCNFGSGSSAQTEVKDETKAGLNSFVEKIGGFDYTQLGICCRNNELLCVEDLISKGADISMAKKDDIYEYDALSVAIENNHLRVVDYLIRHKANVNNVYNEDGLTPLGLAVKVNAVPIVKLLIKSHANINGAKVSDPSYREFPLLIAINSDNINIAKILILSGANVEETDHNGATIKSIILSKGKEWKKLVSDTTSPRESSPELQGEYYAEDSELSEYGISLKFDKGSVIYTESGNMGRTYSQYALLEDKKESNRIFLKYRQTLNGYTGNADRNEYFGVATVVNGNNLLFESDYLKTKFGIGKASFSK